MVRSDPKHSGPAASRALPGGKSRPRKTGPAAEADTAARWKEYARTRDVRLRNQLVEENERLVHYLAARFRPVTALSAEDLVQVGYLGLIAAVERYDPESGASFICFAAPTIVGVIKHYLRDQSWGVKVPRRLRELATRLRRLRTNVEQRLGRVPTPAEMAEAAGVPEELVLEAMEADSVYFSYSLDAHHQERDDEMGDSFMDLLGAEEPEYALAEQRDVIRSLLRNLEPRQRAIVWARFFQDASQTQVAQDLGISQMHVSRLERQALRLLKDLMARENDVS